MSELKIPEDLKDCYKLQKQVMRCFRDEKDTVNLAERTIQLIERIAALEAENERLKAPVSALEKVEFFHNDDWGVPCIYVSALNDMIAARAQKEKQ